MANIPTKRGVPGVYKIENDFSDRITPSVALYVAGLMESVKGEVNTPIDISSEAELVSTFGQPNDTNYETWFNLARVLLYRVGNLGATLRVVRAVGTGSLNGTAEVTASATAAGTPQLIENKKDAEIATISFGAGALLKFISRSPTSETIKIALTNVADFSTADIVTGVAFADNFDDVPEGTEVAIAVLDGSDNILEKYVVDLAEGNVDGFNEDTFIENVIQEKSSYIYAFRSTTAGVPFSFEGLALAGGVYNAPTKADFITALNIFTNVDDIDVNYFIAHTLVQSETFAMAESRQDSVARAGILVADLLGVSEATALTNVQTYTGTTFATNSNYGSMAANIAFVYDKYNNKNRWINLAGDMVGLRIRQNLTNEAWFADAGLNYGQLINVLRLGQSWSVSSQRALIKAKTNPVILKPGSGIVKWEQKNYTSKISALSDENVRELLNFIWRAGRVFLEFKLFEFNDVFTRSQITSQFNRFLQNVQDGRGIRLDANGNNGFFVQCDEQNNTEDVINQNQLIVDISFLPARVVTEIYLRLNILDNTVQLDLRRV